MVTTRSSVCHNGNNETRTEWPVLETTSNVMETLDNDNHRSAVRNCPFFGLNVVHKHAKMTTRANSILITIQWKRLKYDQEDCASVCVCVCTLTSAKHLEHVD